MGKAPHHRWQVKGAKNPRQGRVNGAAHKRIASQCIRGAASVATRVQSSVRRRGKAMRQRKRPIKNQSAAGGRTPILREQAQPKSSMVIRLNADVQTFSLASCFATLSGNFRTCRLPRPLFLLQHRSEEAEKLYVHRVGQHPGHLLPELKTHLPGKVYLFDVRTGLPLDALPKSRTS